MRLGGRNLKVNMNSILDTIESPAALKTLSLGQMQTLAGEIRQRIIDVVCKNGGHLSSNLGVVELTLALHRVFDFTRDRLLWDVGHQSYVHKLITGRQRQFDTLRQEDGLSGFPATRESDYDLFDVGHAGTSIATAVGVARGDSLLDRSNRVVALIGDASIVNGVAFEGLNQAGTLKRQFLVVLNDNSMGIAKTQGGLAATLSRWRLSQLYEETKQRIKQTLPKVPWVGKSFYDALDTLKDRFRASVAPHQIFDQLGFIYIGPVDGHDMEHLITLLDSVKDVPHPVLLHVHTEKGRGCNWASKDPCAFHSPGRMKVEGEQVTVLKGDRKSWTSAFADAAIELAREDQRVFALTAAMPDGTGVAKFIQEFPERSLDCGIAESCTVDVAAGLAKTGLRPLACIYSTFLQRAYDQIFQEVVLQKLPVIFCIDRAGLVGGDGAVHHGYLDIAYLRPYQNLVLMAPADEPELKAMLRLALTLDVPVAIRYPRDTVPDAVSPQANVELGKAHRLIDGPHATILAYGSEVAYALAAADILAAEEIFVSVFNARFAKPIDADMVTTAITRGGPVITVEDHSLTGGFGTAVLETAHRLGLPTETLISLGHAPETFYRHGPRARQLAQAGIDAAGIAAAVRRAVRATGIAEHIRHEVTISTERKLPRTNP